MRRYLIKSLLATAMCLASALVCGAGVRGDANANGTVDIDDVNLMVNAMLGCAGQDIVSQADVDGSGQVDIDDLNVVINVVLGLAPSQGVAEAVDLGLPSGTRWASWNLGASGERDLGDGSSFGDRYAWGETAPKGDDFYYWEDDYTEESYLYAGNRIMLTDISGTEYDAARAQWGAPWRMPTVDEMQELFDLCSWKYVTVEGEVDHCLWTGYIVTGPNGRSIQIPMFYCWIEYPYEPFVEGSDTWHATYWTSTHRFYIGKKYDRAAATALMWQDGEILNCLLDAHTFMGKFIRPVCSGK